MTFLFRSHVQLGTQPRKVTQDAILFQNEKCVVKAQKGALVLPILVHDETRGHMFFGKGELVLDAIVETSRGAVGKSVTRDLDRPFLLLGDSESLLQGLEPVSSQDLLNGGFGSLDQFLRTANEVFDGFAHRPHGHLDIERGAWIFAFATEHGKWDFLIAKDDKLVYTSKERVYISRNNGEGISVGSEGILVARPGKTVVIDRGSVLVDRD